MPHYKQHKKRTAQAYKRSGRLPKAEDLDGKALAAIESVIDTVFDRIDADRVCNMLHIFLMLLERYY